MTQDLDDSFDLGYENSIPKSDDGRSKQLNSSSANLEIKEPNKPSKTMTIRDYTSTGCGVLKVLFIWGFATILVVSIAEEFKNMDALMAILSFFCEVCMVFGCLYWLALVISDCYQRIEDGVFFGPFFVRGALMGSFVTWLCTITYYLVTAQQYLCPIIVTALYFAWLGFLCSEGSGVKKVILCHLPMTVVGAVLASGLAIDVCFLPNMEDWQQLYPGIKDLEDPATQAMVGFGNIAVCVLLAIAFFKIVPKQTQQQAILFLNTAFMILVPNKEQRSGGGILTGGLTIWWCASAYFLGTQQYQRAASLVLLVLGSIGLLLWEQHLCDHVKMLARNHLSHAALGAMIGSTLALWLLIGQLASLDFVQGLENMTQSIVVIDYLVIWSVLSTALAMFCLDNVKFSTDKMQKLQKALVGYSYWASFVMGSWISGGSAATRYHRIHWQHGDRWAIRALFNLAFLGFLCAILATKIMVDEKMAATTNKVEASSIVEEVQVPLLVV